jgi:hypothetical protein
MGFSEWEERYKYNHELLLLLLLFYIDATEKYKQGKKIRTNYLKQQSSLDLDQAQH